MNDKRLGIYLDDHLAMMVAELELITRCRANNDGTPLDQFLQYLENEVVSQKSVVEDMLRRINGGVTVEGRLKQGAAWFAEKVGRFKFNDSLFSYSQLSRVIELETLTAAAQERIALWDNLDVVAGGDSRLEGITFPFHQERSQQHLNELSARRRMAAAEAFGKGSS